MKDVVGRTIGVIDDSGIVVACSELGKVGESKQRIKEELTYSSDSIVYDGYTYRFIGAQGVKKACIVFIEGDDSHASKMAEILSITLGSIKGIYDEKYDKGSFIKNIILDNILPSDIHVKSSELHLNAEDHRVVVVAKFSGFSNVTPYEIVNALITDKSRDYIINIPDQDVVIVKEIAKNTTTEQIEKFCLDLIDTAAKEYSVKVVTGVSSTVDNLKDLARAYKEARISLEVGKVFDIEKPIMSYENLGIGRLIYQLPTTLCDIFLGEVFKKGSLESLDRETLMTVQSFFENNLNVSETSRKLFVHRNTLVYRLEKIRKLTGLDLREFDHAVTFKVALMVKKYLTSKPTKF